MAVPSPIRTETDTEVTYAIYTDGDAEPGHLIVHKTIPYSYTVQPSSLGAAGKAWGDIVAEIDASLGLVGAPA